jgi:ferredoxin
MIYMGLLMQLGIKNISPAHRLMVSMTWNINSNKCLRCGGCVSVCPVAALELRDNVIYDVKLCTLCGVCEKACPVEAIKVTKE